MQLLNTLSQPIVSQVVTMTPKPVLASHVLAMDTNPSSDRTLVAVVLATRSPTRPEVPTVNSAKVHYRRLGEY